MLCGHYDALLLLLLVPACSAVKCSVRSVANAWLPVFEKIFSVFSYITKAILATAN